MDKKTPAQTLKSLIDTLPHAPFCFIRHGETEWNRLAKIAGQHDVPLNERGRQQAQEASQHLLEASDVFTAAHIVSSPLSRARETAEIIASALHLPLTLEPNLQACAWGILEGEHVRHLDREKWAREGLPDGMEHPGAFAVRMLRGVHVALAPGLPAIIVGHAEGCRAVLNALGAQNHPLPNGAIFVFRPPEKAGVPWFIYPLVEVEV